MASPETYNEFSYPSAPFNYSHCRRLETVATLFGMQPTPIPSARVLELGCGDGSNLIPQAENYPDATFLGVDYAQVPIEQGQALIEEVGLTNIQLQTMNVMDLDPTTGPFDYIIAHGLYSWVPPQVQHRIMELLPQLLSPQGVAYISYNTLPGWHLRRTVRDLMLQHTALIEGPAEKVEQAMAILQWVTSAAPEGKPYKAYLEGDLEMLESKPAGYVYHDFLEDQNDAFYFRDFHAQAVSHGLQYLGEAELAYMYPHDLPPQHKQDLAGLPLEVAEQLMDFARNRSFRKTLLCQADVELDRLPTISTLGSLYYGLEEQASLDDLDLKSNQPLHFQVGGNVLPIADPLHQAAIAELAAVFPDSSRAEVIGQRATERLHEAGVDNSLSQQEVTTSICQFCWMLSSMGILEAFVHRPEMWTELSERPRVSRLVQYHAQHDDYTTNRKHRWVHLEPVPRRLLSLLDGARTREDVIQIVAHEIDSGELTVEQTSLSSEEVSRQILGMLVERCLLIE